MKATTLHLMEVAKRAGTGSGGGSTELEERVGILEEKLAGLEEFSTDEVDTGKEWIDGKRIYRKVYTFTPRSFSSGRNEISMDTNIFDSLINARVFDVTSENRRCVQASCRVASSTTMGFYVNDTWADISVAMLEYTKKE